MEVIVSPIFSWFLFTLKRCNVCMCIGTRQVMKPLGIRLVYISPCSWLYALNICKTR